SALPTGSKAPAERPRCDPGAGFGISRFLAPLTGRAVRFSLGGINADSTTGLGSNPHFFWHRAGSRTSAWLAFPRRRTAPLRQFDRRIGRPPAFIAQAETARDSIKRITSRQACSLLGQVISYLVQIASPVGIRNFDPTVNHVRPSPGYDRSIRRST